MRAADAERDGSFVVGDVSAVAGYWTIDAPRRVANLVPLYGQKNIKISWR